MHYFGLDSVRPDVTHYIPIALLAYRSQSKNVGGILLVFPQGYMLDLPRSPPWSHPGSPHL